MVRAPLANALPNAARLSMPVPGVPSLSATAPKFVTDKPCSADGVQTGGTDAAGTEAAADRMKATFVAASSAPTTARRDGAAAARSVLDAIALRVIRLVPMSARPFNHSPTGTQGLGLDSRTIFFARENIPDDRNDALMEAVMLDELNGIHTPRLVRAPVQNCLVEAIDDVFRGGA
jgi:hypothetical protein